MGSSSHRPHTGVTAHRWLVCQTESAPQQRNCDTYGVLTVCHPGSALAFGSRVLIHCKRLPGRGLFRRGTGGHQRDESVEEIIGHLARRPVDQARADLRQLAADLRLDAVAQDSLVALVFERDFGAAFGETGDPALTLAGDRVALRRVQIGERHFAREMGRDRADLGPDLGGEFGVGRLLDALASRDALFQSFGVVELLPDRLPGGGDAALALHFHRGWFRGGRGWPSVVRCRSDCNRGAPRLSPREPWLTWQPAAVICFVRD